MNQRSDGTDDCEREFAHVKGGNNKLTQKYCNEMTLRATGVHLSVFTTINKTNTSGDSSIFSDKITTKLPTRKSRKKKN